jgi:hypothetical protein
MTDEPVTFVVSSARILLYMEVTLIKVILRSMGVSTQID